MCLIMCSIPFIIIGRGRFRLKLSLPRVTTARKYRDFYIKTDCVFKT